MKASSKVSLSQLQEEMQKELRKMSRDIERPNSLNLRHTIGSNPEKQLKSTLKNIRSLKSVNLDAGRKRQCSLSSTRIPEVRPSAMFRKLLSSDKSERKRDLNSPKLEN